jgi:hypothetical protein
MYSREMDLLLRSLRLVGFVAFHSHGRQVVQPELLSTLVDSYKDDILHFSGFPNYLGEAVTRIGKDYFRVGSRS